MLSPNDFRLKQQVAMDHVYQRDQSLLLADVGTGKTVMLLTVLQDWLEEDITDRALVVAPKLVCTDTWMQERHSWSHLDVEPVCLAGESAATRRLLIDDPANKILLINYELLPWLMAEYPDGVPDCNTLILDEVDKLKDHTSKRFAGVPKRRDNDTRAIIPAKPGVKEWRANFEIIVGMTGTPTPSRLLELWAQVYAIDGGKRLGDNYYKFRNAHFYQDDWGGFSYAILPGREEWIYNQIADITHRVASEPGRDEPFVRELPPRWLELPAKVRKLYKELERNYIVEIKRNKRYRELVARDDLTASEELELLTLKDEGVHEIDASEGAAVLYGKLRQMSQGFVYVDGGPPVADTPVQFGEWLFRDKLTELDSLISELQGQQLMIVYHYREQVDELRKRYGRRLTHLGGGVSDADVVAAIDSWNSGELELLAVQPQSAGHGLNLQKSGAHHIVMLTLPETAGLMKQVIGRIARGGNPVGEVFVHRILIRNTVDEERNAVVAGKVMSQNDMLEAMEKRQ